MRKRSRRSVERTEAGLAEIEAKVLAKTTVDLASLRPQISDSASFDVLVAAVRQSTSKNESIAEFTDRIEKLGKGVVAVAKKVAVLLV